jgi:integrase/recombinase XerD
MADSLAGQFAEHELWLTVERRLAANTRAAYRRDLARYESFVRGRGITDAAAIDEQTVAEYVHYLRALRDDDGGVLLAPASIARAVVAVRSFHGFLVGEGLVDTDPSDVVEAPRVPQGIPKALDESEIAALLGAVTGTEPLARRDRAILELLYATGIRISELVGLDLDALDLEDGLVRVLGKGDKERVVPVGRAARQAVRDYLEHGRLMLRTAGRSSNRSARDADAVFLNARGGRLTRQGCWKMVHAVGARVGLADRISPHVLRHSCATHMLDHGADIRVVQELLGHASVSTTQVYTKVSPERLRAVYDASHPRARRSPVKV